MNQIYNNNSIKIIDFGFVKGYAKNDIKLKWQSEIMY